MLQVNRIHLLNNVNQTKKNFYLKNSPIIYRLLVYKFILFHFIQE